MRKLKSTCYFSFCLFPFVANAEDSMAPVARRVERTQPDDTALQITSERQRELDAVEKEISDKRKAFETGQPSAGSLNAPSKTGIPKEPSPEVLNPTGSVKNNAAGAQSQPVNPTGQANAAMEPKPSLRGSKNRKIEGRGFPYSDKKSHAAWPTHTAVFQGSPLQVFAVSKKPNDLEANFTVLPTGAHVKARIVSGVEANAREPYPVLLQLDYAFTGPNKSRIDLSNCFMIAKARANMSTERVMMETESLSCVRENGEHFKREAKGFVAGDDNTFGATGTYISKQGQVLLAAVLASIAKNAGQAIADAQKTTSILGADKASTASNITGNKAAFIGGSALVDGGAMVAQWYLEQAKELLPSIGVGSGQDVFVVMLDTIKVPNLQGEE